MCSVFSLTVTFHFKFVSSVLALLELSVLLEQKLMILMSFSRKGGLGMLHVLSRMFPWHVMSR